MPLTVPALTFSRDEKLGEYLPKDQVTALISALQSSHKEALDGALKPVRDELARIEGLHKEAEKKAKRADDLEAELTTTKAAHERHTTLSELLGITDPADVADVAAIHASRTAGQEKAPSLREWIEAQRAAPDAAPATLRPYLEGAPKREEPAAQPSTQQPRTQVSTGGGRVTQPAGGGRLTVDAVRSAPPGKESTQRLLDQWRTERGLPPRTVDTGGEKK